ncbi:hypothetical protein [Paraburkholderia flagellata]|uniref:hypothetical protein n=1 Tax=Paraburkholderia flagellata TaxID=2883241 RepID=UPI001F2FF3C3|nr:hypothetical protein [Paraburkholderia flagellata]
MRKAIVGMVLAGLLTGCMTSTQRQAQQIASVLKETGAQTKACTMAAYNSPEATPLRVRRPFDVKDATLQQLNDKDTATNDEIAAIYAVHPQYQTCRRNLLENPRHCYSDLSSTTFGRISAGGRESNCACQQVNDMG